MTWSRLDLGVGVIALGSLDGLWEGIQDLVDVVEVEPQTLWDSRTGDGREMSPEALAWLRTCGRPLLAHGVGFPVGGMTAPDPGGVAGMADSARVLEAVHWSEHLAFNVAEGAHAGFLLPPVQSTEGVAAAVRHIADYQSRYPRPFLVETPTNYLQPVPGDLGDGEYVSAIAERADCGILLDLHNIWTNQRNGRQSVEDYVAALPLERVWEVHLAGGFETDSFYLDAHVGPIAHELLEIAAAVVPRLPHVRAVIYEAVPTSLAAQGVDGLREVLAQMHRVVDLPAVETAPSARRPRADLPVGVDGRTAEREAELLAYTTRGAEHPAVADRGALLMRALTDQARLSLLVRHHEDTLRALLEALGAEQTETVLTEFLDATPATAWPDEQSRMFEDWWAERPDLADLVTFRRCPR